MKLLKKNKKAIFNIKRIKEILRVQTDFGFSNKQKWFSNGGKNVVKIQGKLLNVITLGRSLTNSINQMITLSNALVISKT